jgi:hypothetical protein
MRFLQNNDRMYSIGRLQDEYLLDIFSWMEDECLHYRHQGLLLRAGGNNDIDHYWGLDCIVSKAWASELVAD